MNGDGKTIARAAMPKAPEQSTVLIVDDTPTNLEVLHELLDGNGYEVLVAIDGESAFNQAAYAQPDIILLDIMMPGWDGFETCRRLKSEEKTRSIPIIFMTALSEIQDKVRGFELGGVDYITKPLQHEEVLARVHTHITLRRLQKTLQDTNTILEERVHERTARLARLNEVYEKFVPREFIRYLGKESILDVALGDQVQQEMTVFFSDVHGWTSLAENHTPEENFDFINAYFRIVSPIIRERGGFIDQYYGDGIMALFPKNPEDAIAAAVDIQRLVRQPEFHSEFPGFGDLHVGTGMHTGSLMLGIIGEEQRMQGAVVSDNVNLAARLEGLTRLYAASIVVSEQTLHRLEHPERHLHRFVDKVQVKGKHKTVAVYEICDGDPEDIRLLKQETCQDFEAGLRLYYEKKFAESSVRFNRVIEKNPRDKAARIYLERSAGFMVRGVPDDWDGVVALNEK